MIWLHNVFCWLVTMFSTKSLLIGGFREIFTLAITFSNGLPVELNMILTLKGPLWMNLHRFCHCRFLFFCGGCFEIDFLQRITLLVMKKSLWSYNMLVNVYYLIHINVYVWCLEFFIDLVECSGAMPNNVLKHAQSFISLWVLYAIWMIWI